MKYEIKSAVGYVADTQPDYYARVHHALIDDERIGAIEKALFLVLARHANWTTGMAWPGRRTLCLKLHCSPRRIQPALARLSTLGYVEVALTPRKRPVYTLKMPLVPDGTSSDKRLVPSRTKLVPDSTSAGTYAVTERDLSNESSSTREEKRSLTLTQKKPPPRKEKYVPLNGLTQEVMDGIVTRRGS